MGKILRFPQTQVKTIKSAKAYDFTNQGSYKGSFDSEEVQSPWRMLGGNNNLHNYVNQYGSSNWEQLGSASELSKEALETYGKQGLKMFWDSLDKKPVSNFETFIDQVYYDASLKTNFRDEDLPEFGKLMAMYLVDHPYPDRAKLEEGFAKLARRTPTGKIPTKWALGQVISDASKETSFFDLFTVASSAISETADDFKEVAQISLTMTEKFARMALIYKVAALGVAALSVYSVMKEKK